jgi:hypothetical protein
MAHKQVTTSDIQCLKYRREAIARWFLFFRFWRVLGRTSKLV